MRRRPCALHGSQRDTAGARLTDPRTRARDRNGERSRGAETRDREGGGRVAGPHQPRKRRWGKSRTEGGRQAGEPHQSWDSSSLPSLPCSIPSTSLLLVLLLHTKEGWEKHQCHISFQIPVIVSRGWAWWGRGGSDTPGNRLRGTVSCVVVP